MALASRAISRRTWQELFGTRSPAIFYAWRCASNGAFQRCGVENFYQVSSHGRVCNTREVVSYGYLKATGYCSVKISGNWFFVHRLVAFAFLGPPPDDSTWQVHHCDGDKANNRLNNLEYVTPSQNIIASYASQTRRCGGALMSIPVMWRAGGSQTWTTSPSMTQAAAELGMSLDSVVRGCRQGKTVKGYEFQLADSQETRALDGEDWQQMYDPVSGLEVPGRMVSSLGRIKSRSGLISWGCLEKSGYYRTGISLNSDRRNEFVHRLVAFVFLRPPSSQHRAYVNHKDLDKGNNSAENLEYVTCSENMAHFFASIGFRKRMSRPVESRPQASKEWTKHQSIRSAAAALGICTKSISACINRHQASTCGYEFRSATMDILPGEEWRCIDLPALLREKATRKRG